MPIIFSDNTEAQIPRDIARVRREFGIPGGVCLGCDIGDCAPELHDVPDGCDFFGGYVYEVAATREP